MIEIQSYDTYLKRAYMQLGTSEDELFKSHTKTVYVAHKDGVTKFFDTEKEALKFSTIIEVVQQVTNRSKVIIKTRDQAFDLADKLQLEDIYAVYKDVPVSVLKHVMTFANDMITSSNHEEYIETISNLVKFYKAINQETK